MQLSMQTLDCRVGILHFPNIGLPESSIFYILLISQITLCKQLMFNFMKITVISDVALWKSDSGVSMRNDWTTYVYMVQLTQLSTRFNNLERLCLSWFKWFSKETTFCKP